MPFSLKTQSLLLWSWKLQFVNYGEDETLRSVTYDADHFKTYCASMRPQTVTTWSEIIGSNSSVSDTGMQPILDQLSWSDKNNMQMNSIKIKEMILGSASKKDLPSLTIHG